MKDQIVEAGSSGFTRDEKMSTRESIQMILMAETTNKLSTTDNDKTGHGSIKWM